MFIEKAGDPKKAFNFDQMIEEAVDRNRKLRSSPNLQRELVKVKLNESLYENDADFYNSDEGHVYGSDSFELDDDNLENDRDGVSELSDEGFGQGSDIKNQMAELVKKIEMYCADNYDEDQNPELFAACNELMSCFYKFKAKGTPDTNFGPCVLELYRNIKSNKSNSLANQFSREDISQALEDLNQMLGSLEQSSAVYNPFKIGF